MQAATDRMGGFFWGSVQHSTDLHDADGAHTAYI